MWQFAFVIALAVTVNAHRRDRARAPLETTRRLETAVAESGSRRQDCHCWPASTGRRTESPCG